MKMTAMQFAQMLKEASQKIREIDATESLRSVIPVVHESVDANFFRQVDKDGRAWPPRKDKLPHPLLIKSGAMLYAAGGGQGHIEDVQRDKLKMGVNLSVIKYARRQNRGDAEINLPARQYFYLHGEDVPRLRAVFRESIRPSVASIFRGAS